MGQSERSDGDVRKEADAELAEASRLLRNPYPSYFVAGTTLLGAAGVMTTCSDIGWSSAASTPSSNTYRPE